MGSKSCGEDVQNLGVEVTEPCQVDPFSDNELSLYEVPYSSEREIVDGMHGEIESEVTVQVSKLLNIVFNEVFSNQLFEILSTASTQ